MEHNWKLDEEYQNSTFYLCAICGLEKHIYKGELVEYYLYDQPNVSFGSTEQTCAKIIMLEVMK